jgi:hypothetical protein
MENSDINPVTLPKLFRCADNERFSIVDNPADIVWNPSGGKRGVWTPLENDNLKFRTMAFCL